MSAAIYLRVSPSDPKQESIENQRELAEGYIKLYNIDVRAEHWYEDDQVFSTLDLKDRPKGVVLLRDALQGRFNTVIVSRFDRLARDPRLTLNVVHELAQHNIKVVSIREQVDTDTPAGRMMLVMLAGFAGYERESIIERTSAGMDRVAREGTWMGGVVTFGYQVAGRKREARLIPSLEPMAGAEMSEAQWVRWVYQHIITEHGSCESAARHLNRLGVRPRGGRIWYASTIYRLLTNRTYRGVHNWRGIERPCERLVDDETWALAQRQLGMNRRMSKRNAKAEYLLGGLIKCGRCGSGYTGRAVAQKYRYYVCVRRSLTYPPCESTVRCNGPNIPASFDDVIWADIEIFAKNPGEVLDEIEENQEVSIDLVEQLTTERVALSRQLGSKDDEKNLILDLYRTRIINQTKVGEQFAIIDQQVVALKEQIVGIEQRLRGVDLSKQQVAAAGAVLTGLREFIAGNPTFDEKRRKVLQLVESVVVDDDRLRVRYLFDPPTKETYRHTFELHAARPMQLYRQYALERK